MRLLIKIIAPILALMLIGGCTGGLPEITTELIESISSAITPEASSDSAPLTDETTEETTAEETTEETTAEETTAHPLAGFSAAELLLKSEELAEGYTSFLRTSSTRTAIRIGGAESASEISSELRVSGDNASFLRVSGEEKEQIFFVSNEIYYNTANARLRVGSHTLSEFIDTVSDSSALVLFDGGEVILGEDGVILHFTVLGNGGAAQICAMLGLPEGYEVEITRSELTAELDTDLNMTESRLELEISVISDGTEAMSASVCTETEQSEIGGEVALELPAPRDYVYFASERDLASYRNSLSLIASFPESFGRFQFTVRDESSVKSENVNVSISAKDIYAYYNRAGISIDRNFNVPGSTKPHRTVTFYNFRGCYSQVDNGTVFEDTAINKNNLELTLSYPFTTSFFALEHCTGMIDELSGEKTLTLALTEDACRNIASKLLLNAGVVCNDPEFSGDTVGYTHITLDEKGGLAAIGYKFSATVTANGKEYKLEHTVSLKIDSTTYSNIIYLQLTKTD